MVFCAESRCPLSYYISISPLVFPKSNHKTQQKFWGNHVITWLDWFSTYTLTLMQWAFCLKMISAHIVWQRTVHAQYKIIHAGSIFLCLVLIVYFSQNPRDRWYRKNHSNSESTSAYEISKHKIKNGANCMQILWTPLNIYQFNYCNLWLAGLNYVVWDTPCSVLVYCGPIFSLWNTADSS